MVTLCPPARMQTDPGSSCPHRWHLLAPGDRVGGMSACSTPPTACSARLLEIAPDGVHDGAHAAATWLASGRADMCMWMDKALTAGNKPAEPAQAAPVFHSMLLGI